ncbi:PAS domain-containing protein [Tsuneonella sp. SYSU-LHT278]|uniref:PAS domain-containing protein n=1 Tax=Tsuneonella sediminis TaxID=3416089 RepID=UPI003F797D1F
MDNLRGYLGAADFGGEGTDYGPGDDEAGNEPPPSPVGQDERRMQVRAYNHWASLLADRNFPSIEDLEPDALPDFGPHSVLLDFTNGIEDPAIRFLGDQLAEECDIAGAIDKLSDVPHRSLLTRITDHYMQILANQAPIGFEAEFVNQRGATILYRGILLPFSSDDDTIDFIYGVINWKQMADQLTSDELLLEIDQALEADDGRPHRADPVTDWADGPGADTPGEAGAPPVRLDAPSPLAIKPAPADPFPQPAFGNDDGADEDEDADLYEAIEAVDDEPEGPSRFASLLGLGGGAGVASGFDEDDEEDYDADEDPVAKWLNRPTPLGALPDVAFGEDEGDAAIPHLVARPTQPSEPDPAEGIDDARDEPFELNEEVAEDAARPVTVEAAQGPADAAEAVVSGPADTGGLYDCLAEARELALAARSCEDRSRTALYAAVGRAYDVSLAAEAEPAEFAELIADSGLTMQDRAPMTPVVKLVFGADYDKTRLTEYAAVLTHAHRLGIERGALAGFLGQAEGGLKGVVQAERALRRADEGDETARETPREALARKLREIAPLGFEDIAQEGEEFALVMIRRVDGEVVVLGEIADAALVEKAARKLVA